MRQNVERMRYQFFQILGLISVGRKKNMFGDMAQDCNQCTQLEDVNCLRMRIFLQTK